MAASPETVSVEPKPRRSSGPIVRRDTCAPKIITFDPETGQTRETCPVR